MQSPARIALIGDYNPDVKAHVAVPAALGLAAAALGVDVEAAWTPTTRLDPQADELLSGFDAIWCVPNSPYASMNGALNGIRFARESGRPFLGTCGGFQHAIIEYVRNVLGFSEADHAETHPDAAMPVVAPLACSLGGARGRVRLQPGSRLSAIYAAAETDEQYQCNFGFNPRYESLLRGEAMAVAARDENGEVRAVELAGHPFFVATLFQPERSAATGVAHPLICAFVSAALHSNSAGTGLPYTAQVKAVENIGMK